MFANAIQIIVDALSLGSIYAITGLGIGVIFSVMRLINFAQAQYIALSTFAMLLPVSTGLTQLPATELPALVLIPIVLALGVLMAVASEVVLFRHLRYASGSTMMIASFALGAAIQNLLLMSFGSRPYALDLWSNLTQPLDLGGVRVPILQLVVIAVIAVVLLALVFFLQRTRFGLAMRAAAENFTMARMLGVAANRVIMAAFAISGALAAMTSLLLLPQTGLADIRMGDQIVLMAFVATVIGGLGSLVGVVATGFIIGAISILLQTFLPVDLRPFRDAFVYVAVILVLLVRPDGLFIPKARRGRI